MARQEATRERIGQFLQRLGRVFRGTGRLYLVGGTMMVYQGFRLQTQDVDYVLELTAGDQGDFVQALRQVQQEINLNVEAGRPARHRRRAGTASGRAGDSRAATGRL